MDHVISIEHGHSIVTFKRDLGECPANIVRFSRAFGVVSFEDKGATGLGDIFGPVGTGIAGDVNVEEFLWVILLLEALKEGVDDFLFIVGRDKDGKSPEGSCLGKGLRREETS